MRFPTFAARRELLQRAVAELQRAVAELQRALES